MSWRNTLTEAATAGASFRRLRLIGRQGSDALPTLAGLLIKVIQQTCPRILADYLRTAEPQTPSDVMKEWGLLPLPAAPPSGDAWEYRNAVREGEEAPKWKRMQDCSMWEWIYTDAGR